jgi:hypothetical protein
MAYAHSDVLDNGPAYIAANAKEVLLVSSYTAGDSYATVQTNKVGKATISSADFALASSGFNRKLTFAGKTGAASATVAAGNDLQFVFTDGAAKVLWAAQETSNMAVTSGNPLTFPALTYTSNQPTDA